jgi:dimethylglycine dehydrogenase
MDGGCDGGFSHERAGGDHWRGAVGASSLYHLAKAGWTDCVLLEKNELTAGSTWHAAGNVPTFSSSWSIMNMQRYSAQLYRGLGEAVDYPMNYHVTGSVRLGHSKERLQEFKRVVGMGRYQGMDLDILSPEEIGRAIPSLRRMICRARSMTRMTAISTPRS